MNAPKHQEDPARAIGQYSKPSNGNFGGASFWVGLVLGALAGISLFFLWKYFKLEDAKAQIGTAGLIALLTVFGFCFLFVFLTRVIKKVSGREPPSLVSVVESAKLAVNHAIDRNAKEAVNETAVVLQSLATVYGLITLRHWMMTTALAAVALFAGTITTLLLFEQNSILERQDLKLGEQLTAIQTQTGVLQKQLDTAERQLTATERQTAVMLRQAALTAAQIRVSEAQRRIPLYGELTELTTLLGRNREATFTPAKVRNIVRLSWSDPVSGQEQLDSLLHTLQPEQRVRIESLARALKPYFYVANVLPATVAGRVVGDTDEEVAGGQGPPEPSVPLEYGSVERGLLFEALVSNFTRLDQFNGLDLQYADSSNVVFRQPWVTFEQPSVCLADAGGPVKEEVVLFPIVGVSLQHARFNGALLEGLRFGEDHDIRDVSFHGARLSNVEFVVSWGGLDLSSAILQEVRISGSLFPGSLGPGSISVDNATIGTLCFSPSAEAALEAGNVTGIFTFREFFLSSELGRSDVEDVKRFLVTGMRIPEQEVEELEITEMTGPHRFRVTRP